MSWTERAIGRLQRKWSSSEDMERRREAKRRLSYYGGDQLRRIPRMPQETAEHAAAKPRFAPGILQLAINTLSYLFAAGVSRTGIAEERWRQILWDYGDGLDALLLDIDPLVRLTGQVTLAVGFSPIEGMARDYAAVLAGASPPPGAPGIDLVPYTPDRVCAITTATDPRYAEAIVLDIGPSKEGHTKGGRLLYYWDAANFAMIDTSYGATWRLIPIPTSEGELQIVPHPYGRIPIVEVRNTRVYEDYWPIPLGGRDLLGNIDTLNRSFTEYLWNCLIARGQPWRRGAGHGIWLAPDSVWELDDSPTAACGIMAPGGDLAGQRQGVSTALAAFARCAGIPPRAFQLEDLDAQSGVAIWLDRQDLHNDRLLRTRLARGWDRRIHRAASVVWDAHTGEYVDPQLEVTYPDPVPPPSNDQRREGVKVKLDYSLIDRVQALLELEPSLSPAEAASRIAAADADSVGLAMAEPISSSAPPPDEELPPEEPPAEEEA